MVDSVEIDNKQHEVKIGDVFFTTSSETPGEVGMSSVLKEKHGITYLNSFCFGFRPNVKFDLDYLAYMLRSKHTRKQITLLAQGISRFNISKNKMMDINIYVPTIDEQAKIGACFYSVNKHITLHQRKLEQLEQLKNTLLSKMFPKSGTNIPEIRFSGFTDAWEQRKLESICDVRDGTHESPQYYSTGFPLITSKNVKEGSINYEGVQYISKTDYEKINQRSKVDKNDILIGMIGTIGNIALIRNEANFAIKNVALVKNIGEVSHVYLFHYLSSTIVQKQLQESMDGGTQKFISLKKIRSLKICISSSDEQNHIGQFFEKLDKLITIHQRKLEQLKNLKQTLLNKMFI